MVNVGCFFWLSIECLSTNLKIISYFHNSLCRFSWIHVDDLVNLIYEALTNPSYKGNNIHTCPLCYLLRIGQGKHNAIGAGCWQELLMGLRRIRLGLGKCASS